MTALGMRVDEPSRILGQGFIDACKASGETSVERMFEIRRLMLKFRSYVENNLELKTKIEVKEYLTKQGGRVLRKLLKFNPRNKKEDLHMMKGAQRITQITDSQNKVYPLIDWIEGSPDKLDIKDWWEEDEGYYPDFTLGLEEWEGNCAGCYKKSTKKLLKNIRDNRDLFENDLEIRYGDIGQNKIKGKFTNAPRTMYRQYHTCQSLIELYENTPKTYLRDGIEESDEMESGCSSSCLAFGGDKDNFSLEDGNSILIDVSYYK